MENLHIINAAEIAFKYSIVTGIRYDSTQSSWLMSKNSHLNVTITTQHEKQEFNPF